MQKWFQLPSGRYMSYDGPDKNMPDELHGLTPLEGLPPTPAVTAPEDPLAARVAELEARLDAINGRRP